MEAEDSKIVQLAIGRILRLASRPEQPGDMAEYYRCRSLILDRCESQPDNRPCYERDRHKGAAGD